MSKVIDFFKRIPNLYYNWKKRNDNLSAFLEESKHNKDKLSHIDDSVSHLKDNLIHVKQDISDLSNQVDQVNSRLESIGEGTKMELFDTLCEQRITLVTQKKWASPSDKRRVEEIYKVYHDDLGGNGLGEHYYNEIMSLPESEQELEVLNNGKF